MQWTTMVKGEEEIVWIANEERLISIAANMTILSDFMIDMENFTMLCAYEDKIYFSSAGEAKIAIYSTTNNTFTYHTYSTSSSITGDLISQNMIVSRDEKSLILLQMNTTNVAVSKIDRFLLTMPYASLTWPTSSPFSLGYIPDLVEDINNKVYFVVNLNTLVQVNLLDGYAGTVPLSYSSYSRSIASSIAYEPITNTLVTFVSTLDFSPFFSILDASAGDLHAIYNTYFYIVSDVTKTDVKYDNITDIMSVNFYDNMDIRTYEITGLSPFSPPSPPLPPSNWCGSHCTLSIAMIAVGGVLVVVVIVGTLVYRRYRMRSDGESASLLRH
eukprot:TRINITY_DN4818_c0_g1_i4.p1 TRINITY_DN4818_c0_g1~~TRINITY_DN4818_c0_g1_i4.p1  ORF type:complete len:329 (-),score=84.10 TRINITY_DN4818_c0_g1_i4:113-1099(-)